MRSKYYKNLIGIILFVVLTSCSTTRNNKNNTTTIMETNEILPPLMPHGISDYKISIDSNECLNCHIDLVAGAEKDVIPKVSSKHIKNNEIKGSMYYCLQCHIVQNR